MIKIRRRAKHILTSQCSNVDIVFAQGPLKVEFLTGMHSITTPTFFNQHFLEDINKLSVKACFLLNSQSQLNAFSDAVSTRGGKFKYQKIGSDIIVQYPL